MLLEIIQQPNPLLHEKSAKVTKFTPELFKLCKDLIETMYASNGVGLAAVQVGQPIRIIVFDETQERNEPKVLINPEITSHSKNKIPSIEGCLSCRGQEREVQRYAKITVKGKTLAGKTVTLKAEGMLARVLQHEIDHLSGVIILDIGKTVPPAEARQSAGEGII